VSTSTEPDRLRVTVLNKIYSIKKNILAALQQGASNEANIPR
jgi:hypothetical protein